MGMMKQEYIAWTRGAEYTMYAVMKRLNIPLSERQAKCQEYLEQKYGGKKGTKNG